MKKNKKQKAIVINEQYTEQWNLAQNIGRYKEWLNRLPDAAAVSRQQRRSAPQRLFTMRF